MTLDLCVVKIGGSCIAQDAQRTVGQAASLVRSRPCVYVHGYGPELRTLLSVLGVERKTFVSASGVPSHFTTEEVAILSELAAVRVRSKLAACFGAIGVPILAVPSFVDGLVLGARKDRIRYNDCGVMRIYNSDCSGKVIHVSVDKMEQALEQHGNLLLSPVLRDEQQRTMVVDGDHLAFELGIALRVRSMYLLSDNAGVLVEGKTVQTMCQSSIPELTTYTSGGMTRKLKYVQHALRGGIAEVLLLQGSSVMEGEAYNGTCFRQD